MERYLPACEYAAYWNDPENVEDGASDDGADAQVRLGDEGPHDVGEELRRRRARGHESRSGHVRGQLKNVGQFFLHLNFPALINR